MRDAMEEQEFRFFGVGQGISSKHKEKMDRAAREIAAASENVEIKLGFAIGIY